MLAQLNCASITIGYNLACVAAFSAYFGATSYTLLIWQYESQFLEIEIKFHSKDKIINLKSSVAKCSHSLKKMKYGEMTGSQLLGIVTEMMNVFQINIVSFAVSILKLETYILLKEDSGVLLRMQYLKSIDRNGAVC
ncbi:hypothetical protein evm_014427 [Chilo suppressalis]|nr:hypothetical protein evm_014427 [Chilo suppressalis]